METKTTIAIIDDDNSVRKSVALNLEQEGFKVLEAEDGEKGISLVEEKKPDVIILDIKMPRKDGFQVCKELRNKGISTPLILLTARSEEVDKVLGLELGADDYLAKPFGMLELVARVKALLRRNKSTKELEKVEFSGIKIDFKAYKAEKESKPIDLSAREYRLLKCLIAKKGSVVTRDELLDEVWGYNTYPTTRTVDNHIARLRQKIEEKNSKTPKHILTVHGVGYKFVV
ncbi:MAG: response regulator transcription factor [Bdellovibrionota bacterium]|nr:response regulator transcription factor [Pseudomonadota bacterium]MDY6090776.1 response regulator transcription factor [Bdellovibrionota bacterium]